MSVMDSITAVLGGVNAAAQAVFYTNRGNAAADTHNDAYKKTQQADKPTQSQLGNADTKKTTPTIALKGQPTSFIFRENFTAAGKKVIDDTLTSLNNIKDEAIETTSAINRGLSSASDAATKATTSLYSSIYTPAEQMVRDKLITEVSNIARKHESPDEVHTLTGVINRDMTHGELRIDENIVMSDVSKTLDKIPDMKSKIEYVNKLTAMVNNYRDMLANYMEPI